MSIPLKDFRATIWAIEDKNGYAKVNLSTSRKDKKTNEYANSSWFANFVMEAYKEVVGLDRGTRIVVKSGTLKKEPYIDAEGVKQFPKNPAMTVFDFELYVPDPNYDKPPTIEDEEMPPPTEEEYTGDELPF